MAARRSWSKPHHDAWLHQHAGGRLLGDDHGVAALRVPLDGAAVQAPGAHDAFGLGQGPAQGVGDR